MQIILLTVLCFLFSFAQGSNSVADKAVQAESSTKETTISSRTLSSFPLTIVSSSSFFTKTVSPFHSDGKNWNFADGSKVQAKIEPSQIIRNITPYCFGCNLAWYDGKKWLLDPDRVEKAKECGIKYWRFPGGSASNDYYWDGNYKDHTQDFDGLNTARMNGPNAVSTDDFIEFCRETGSEAVVTVNYAIARYAGLSVAADMAARWVRYFNVEKKFKVRYWEIGNECYGPWEQGNQLQGLPNSPATLMGKIF